MGYQYGIKQCQETLLELSNESDFESRMVRAHSEIGVITSEDVHPKHFQEIKAWRERYLALKNLAVTKEGKLKIVDKISQYKRLASELVYLCIDIIEHNTRNRYNRSVD